MIAPEGAPDALRLRAVLSLGQLATFVSTWPLWQPRHTPPLLPAFDVHLDAIPWGVPLLLSVLAAWRWPKIGSAVHLLLLLMACALDASRFGPAPLSLAILSCATSTPRLTPLGRAQLSAMWLWAGLHKLLSPAYFAVLVPIAGTALSPWIPPWVLGLSVACVEIALGLCAAFDRTRVVARVLAPLVHLGALAILVALDVNPGVWAWNATLAWCAPAILASSPAIGTASASPRVLAAVLYVTPALHYGGLLHPSLTHQLYSGATPTTLTCRVDGCRSDVEAHEGLAHFGVPIPPSPATLRAYFLATCAAGDRWVLRSRTRGHTYGTVLDRAICADRP